MYTRLLTYWNATDSSAPINHSQHASVKVFLFSHSGLVNEMLIVLMFFTDLAFLCRGKQNKHPFEIKVEDRTCCSYVGRECCKYV